jgi:hypothetical protein
MLTIGAYHPEDEILKAAISKYGKNVSLGREVLRQVTADCFMMWDASAAMGSYLIFACTQNAQAVQSQVKLFDVVVLENGRADLFSS